MSVLDAKVQEKLSEVLREHMPAAVGEELKALLTEAEMNKTKVTELMQESLDLRSRLNESISKANSFEGQLNELKIADNKRAEKDADLSKREQALEVALLKKDLESMTAQRQAIYSLTEIVFKNNVVKQNVFGSVPVVQPTGQYGMASVTTMPTSSYSTAEVE